MHRREFLALPAFASAAPQTEAGTRFQVACMTLPYGAFPFERALSGIQSAGYKYVAWGVSHRDAGGVSRPLLAVDAPPADARQLSRRSSDAGLQPVMMFSTVNFEEPKAADAYRRRVDQAEAAKIPFIIVFGKTSAGEYDPVVRNLRGVADHARSAGVTIVIKQHGGNTATGEHCSRIIADVGHDAVRMCYDAGNVLDYENHDPLPDIRKCWRDVRAFAIKDHRNFPKDEDCGIGFGEIDHYKLLAPVMRTGLAMPLAAENIFEPLVPRPDRPEGIDRLARRSREFLEAVLAGLERTPAATTA
ncbi:MAG TPA: TIM barrel protein [Bryobacteraceae bacterium]|nr:TIM barrel protein [Bryobacteraceae bacterium]